MNGVYKKNMINPMLESALYFLNQGFSLVPADPAKGLFYVPWKDYQNKKPTGLEIRDWWKKWPDAGIAIITGKISKIIVIDVDTHKGADINFCKLGDYEWGTPTVLSGGGGKHFYFAYQEGIKTSAGMLAPHIDIRSDGGCIFAPPSIHKTGKAYTWLTPLGSVNLMAFPPDIAALLNKKKEAITTTDWKSILTGNINTGGRNSTATSVCGKLMLRFRPEEWAEQVWPLLVSWNSQVSSPPLGERELRQIYESIGKTESSRRKSGNAVGDPQISKENEQYVVSVPIQDGFAVFTFSEVEHKKNREIDALVKCQIDIPGGTQTPLTLRLNIISSSGRESFARQLNACFGKETPWPLILSQACTLLESTLAMQSEVVEFGDILPQSTSYLLYPFIQERVPNILFGRGSSGKTFLALRMALSLATGIDCLGETPSKVLNFMLVDYENTASTFQTRLTQLAKACPDITIEQLKGRCFYLNPKGVSIPDMVKKIKQEIEEKHLEFIIIDSAILAAGGAPEESQTALRYFNSLNSLGITTLTIAHETKAENKNMPFGSVVFYNSARNIWNVQVQQEQDENVIHSGLVHRKANDDRLHSTKSARIYFGDDMVDINPESNSRWEDGVPLKKRIMNSLEESPKSLDGLATDLDIKKSILKARLTELRSREYVVNSNHVWSLVVKKEPELDSLETLSFNQE